MEERERLARSGKVKEEKHSRDIGELREYIGMKTCLHGPMDYEKKLEKLRFRVGDLDLPEGRKISYASSRKEENMDAQLCLCGTNNRLGLTY